MILATVAILTARLAVFATRLAVLATRLAMLATTAMFAILATREFRERTLHTTRGTIQRFRNADCRTVKRTPRDIHRGSRNISNSTLRRAHYTANEARRLA